MRQTETEVFYHSSSSKNKMQTNALKDLSGVTNFIRK